MVFLTGRRLTILYAYYLPINYSNWTLISYSKHGRIQRIVQWTADTPFSVKLCIIFKEFSVT